MGGRRPAPRGRPALWLPVLRRALVVVPLVFGGACTLVLDPGNLPPQTDAQPIDARSIDADPGLLAIDRVEPTTILEGTGAGGGRAALFVLHGRSLVGSATVTAELVGPTTVALPLGEDDYAATFDGAMAGIAVRIPVLPDLAAGAPRTLRLTVTQGLVSASKDVTVLGLGELTLPDAAPLAAMYSQITVNGAVHFTGTAPVRLAATGEVRLTARLDVNATMDTPGPHGCAGAAGGGQGTCTPGGGGAGTGAVGNGGGGGFGAPGTGGGDNGGAPGAATGRDTLVKLLSDAGEAGNRGNGGGGGSGGGLGGKGGGGGGVLYLAAGGDITVTASGAIEADGGAGSNGSGGGGGGSGGAILVRAGGMITAPSAWLSAEGAAGGMGTTGTGGAGGIGRIRLDAAAGNLAGMATRPMAFRGPSWDRTNPVLVDTAPNLVLLGQPGRAFGLRLNDVEVATPATPGANGQAAIRLTLERGRNEVCAVAEPGMLLPESLSCIELFYTGG